MRILVVGAGVVGVTSAHALAERGHAVELVDGRAQVAGAASAVNAGLLAPGDSVVWGSPAVPGLLARSLLGRGAGFLRVRRAAGPALLPWGVRFLRECTPARSARNVAAAHRLSAYSYDELERLLAASGIACDHERNGMVLLYRDAGGLRDGLAARAGLAAAGEVYRQLTPAELEALDHAYAAAAPRLAGAIHAQGAGHGDCGAFTRGLARRCEQLGVTLSLGRPVERIEARGDRVVAVHTAAGALTADAYVLAAGAWSAPLARGAGLRLPILPAKGYAVTVPIVAPERVPHVGGVDENAHVAFSRMGERLRLSSTAELAGYDERVAERDLASIRRAADALFPDALDWAGAQRHSGLRPMTPRGVPLIGPAGSNLFLNTGHGHLGWTQACGSARLLADLVDARQPAIAPDPYLP